MVKVALLVGVSQYKSGFTPLPNVSSTKPKKYNFSSLDGSSTSLKPSFFRKKIITPNSELRTPNSGLPSAVEDIKAMQRVLQEKGEFEVTTLANPKPYEMQSEIDRLFANRTKDDLVLFYFSGHGVKDYRRKFYLTTSETSKDTQRIVVPYTAVAASYLQSQMTDSRSERQVVILDCCYSGAIAQGLTVKGESEIDIQAELGGKGRAILTSSTPTQESYVQDGSKLSIYTHYLVEGMETGAADLDSDGSISVDELHEYTSKRVQEASPAMTPKFYPVEQGYTIYLARSPIDDPKLKYRKAVQEIVRENKGEIDSLLDRPYLDELSHKLEISLEDTKIIETEVLEPLRQRQQKLKLYEEVFSQAFPKNSVLTDKTRRKLKRLQKVLELRDEDIVPIEEQLNSQSQPELEVTESPTAPANLTLETFKFEVKTVNAEGKVIEQQKRQAQFFKEDLGDNVILEMVSIPGGKFLMGTEDEEIERLVEKFNWNGFRKEKPQHEVTVQPFFMGKYPITQAQWKAIASLTKINRDLQADPSNFQGYDRPVEAVSWEDAVEFCQRLSKATGKEYRLPTEAEWEYACRAGTTTPFYFGETITGELANYRASNTYANEPQGEYRRQTTPVGNFPPNPFGLYDMHGQVWEWCEDDWHDNYQSLPMDGSAWLSRTSSKKVIRGGSWVYSPHLCRSAYRGLSTRDVRSNSIGVRVVCVAPRTT